MKNDIKMLQNVVRHSFTAVAETHKIHEVQADIFKARYTVLEWIRIIVAGATSAGLIAILFEKDEFWIKLITAIASFITAIITGVMQSFDLKDGESSQKATARKLLRLRDEYITLLMEIRNGRRDYESLLEQYKSLEKQKHEIYEDAPRTTDKASRKAMKKLHVNLDNQFSEEETDILLPEYLRGEGEVVTKQ